MIDFDNPNTFPKELKNWGTEFEKMILRKVNTNNIEEGGKLNISCRGLESVNRSWLLILLKKIWI